jgi:hypothetical protein
MVIAIFIGLDEHLPVISSSRSIIFGFRIWVSNLAYAFSIMSLLPPGLQKEKYRRSSADKH